MAYISLILFLLLDISVAFIIAAHQQCKGYKFLNSFVGTLLGLIGLTLLSIKAYLDFIK